MKTGDYIGAEALDRPIFQQIIGLPSKGVFDRSAVQDHKYMPKFDFSGLGTEKVILEATTLLGELAPYEGVQAKIEPIPNSDDHLLALKSATTKLSGHSDPGAAVNMVEMVGTSWGDRKMNWSISRYLEPGSQAAYVAGIDVVNPCSYSKAAGFVLGDWFQDDNENVEHGKYLRQLLKEGCPHCMGIVGSKFELVDWKGFGTADTGVHDLAAASGEPCNELLGARASWCSFEPIYWHQAMRAVHIYYDQAQFVPLGEKIGSKLGACSGYLLPNGKQVVTAAHCLRIWPNEFDGADKEILDKETWKKACVEGKLRFEVIGLSQTATIGASVAEQLTCQSVTVWPDDLAVFNLSTSVTLADMGEVVKRTVPTKDDILARREVFTLQFPHKAGLYNTIGELRPLKDCMIAFTSRYHSEGKNDISAALNAYGCISASSLSGGSGGPVFMKRVVNGLEEFFFIGVLQGAMTNDADQELGSITGRIQIPADCGTDGECNLIRLYDPTLEAGITANK